MFGIMAPTGGNDFFQFLSHSSSFWLRSFPAWFFSCCLKTVSEETMSLLMKLSISNPLPHNSLFTTRESVSLYMAAITQVMDSATLQQTNTINYYGWLLVSSTDILCHPTLHIQLVDHWNERWNRNGENKSLWKCQSERSHFKTYEIKIYTHV